MSGPGRPRRPQTAGAPLARVLRGHRERIGLTRDEVARRARMSINTLMALEQGRTADPGFFKVAAVCAVLDVSLGDLQDEVGATLTTEGTQMTNGLVSVGYEGRSIEMFVEALVRAGVATVADVRMTPLSRKPGFSKTKLTTALAEAGIAYLHLKSLGNPKSNREPFWNGRAAEGQAVFRDLLQEESAVAALDRLTELASEEVVAVLCFEQDQASCHRQVVIDEVTRQQDVPVMALT